MAVIQHHVAKQSHWLLMAGSVLLILLALFGGRSKSEARVKADPLAAAENARAEARAAKDAEPVPATHKGRVERKAERTIREYEEALAENPDSEAAPGMLVAMGTLYRRKLDNIDEAIRCYELAIHDYADSEHLGHVWLELAGCYEDKQDYESLKWLCDEMEDRFPEDSPEYAYVQKTLDWLPGMLAL